MPNPTISDRLRAEAIAAGPNHPAFTVLREAADAIDECERFLVPLQEDYAYDGEPDQELDGLLAKLRGEAKGGG